MHARSQSLRTLKHPTRVCPVCCVSDTGDSSGFIPTYLGQFFVTDGASASSNPAALSCQEVCQTLFGDGEYISYSGSLSMDYITKTCYGEFYSERCGTAADDFKGPASNVLTPGTFSTYVSGSQNCNIVSASHNDTSSSRQSSYLSWFVTDNCMIFNPSVV